MMNVLWLVLFLLVVLGIVVWYKQKKYEEQVVVIPPKAPETFKVVEEIKGQDPPSVYASLNKLLDAYASGEEAAVIELARIYMYGLHPFFLPDKLPAGQICNFIIFGDQFSKVAKLKAKELLGDIRYDDGPIHDRTYVPLPANPVDMLQSIPVVGPLNAMIALATTVPDMPVPRIRHEVPTFDFEVNINDIDLEMQETLFAQFDYGVVAAAAVTAVQNDSQNVHSSTVQKVASTRLQNLENENNGLGQGNNTSFLNWLSTSDMSAEQKENIGQVLTSLTDSPHSRYGRSEKEVFDTVWKRVNAPVNRDNFDEMAKVFADSIASAVEHDHVVCSTGKIVRMIGSLDAMDAEPEKMGGALKPEWALDTEMAGVAAKIREDVLKSAPKHQQAAYEEGSPDSVLENVMKNTLQDRLKKDYIDTNLLSKEAVDLKYEVLSAAY